MNESFFDMTRSLLQATRFNRFWQGVSVTLPTGEKLMLKITKCQRIHPKEFRFSKYTYITEMRGGGFAEIGCGEGGFPHLAIERSIAEAVERVLFRALKGSRFGTLTSNGWASHLNSELAKRSALMELLERDAALVHWFCKIPLLQRQRPCSGGNLKESLPG